MPARRKDLLLQLMQLTAEPPDGMWHASVLTTLEDVDAARARWRPAPGRPSIWNLVRHLTHWKRGLMRAWDEGEIDVAAWWDRDWEALPEGADASTWRDDVAELARVTRGLAERIAAADERLLDHEVGGLDGGVARHALQVATHDAYHAGQIRLLLRLQEAEAQAGPPEAAREDG